MKEFKELHPFFKLIAVIVFYIPMILYFFQGDTALLFIEIGFLSAIFIKCLVECKEFKE